MVTIAAADRVDREALLEFVRDRHHFTLLSVRRDGRPHLSPVTGGVDADGRLVVSTYPERAKALHLRRDPACAVLVHSDDWDGSYVQVYGTAEVLDMPTPEAEEGLVDYFRCIAGRAPGLGRVPRRHASSGQVADPDHRDRLGSGGARRVPTGPGAGLRGPAARVRT